MLLNQVVGHVGHEVLYGATLHGTNFMLTPGLMPSMVPGN